MNISKVFFINTYHLGDNNYRKIGVELDVKEGDNAMDGLRTARDMVVECNAESGGQPVLIKTEYSNVRDDVAWELLKQSLSEIEFQEDAYEYLNTTDFKYAIEAKNICNSKPHKK